MLKLWQCPALDLLTLPVARRCRAVGRCQRRWSLADTLPSNLANVTAEIHLANYRINLVVPYLHSDHQQGIDWESAMGPVEDSRHWKGISGIMRLGGGKVTGGGENKICLILFIHASSLTHHPVALLGLNAQRALTSLLASSSQKQAFFYLLSSSLLWTSKINWNLWERSFFPSRSLIL